MINGNKYWTCKQTIESENCSEDSPNKPWQGIFVKSGENTTYGLLHRFDHKDRLDSDPNATAYVYEKDLFETEAEALVDYRKKCLRYAGYLKKQYEFYIEESQC